MRLTRFLVVHVHTVAGLLLLAWLLVALGSGLGWWRPRPAWLAWGLTSAMGVVLMSVWVRWQRENLLRHAPLPQFLRRKLRDTYPQLSLKDLELVERGLRQFFLACLRSRRKFVAMPSQVVDAMWHEFILHTRAYRDWCELTLGWFLHHTPALALGAQSKNNDGLRRAWYWACRDEAIKPEKPSRLPLLFALDAKLGIPNGFHYMPDCRDIARKSAAGESGPSTYCGTSFSDGSYSGDADGFGGMDSSSSDSGGADGGDSGGGCGGGGD